MKLTSCFLRQPSIRPSRWLTPPGILLLLACSTPAAAITDPAAITADGGSGALLGLACVTAILLIALLSRQLTIRRLRRDLDSLHAEHLSMQSDLQRLTAIMNQATEAIMITDPQTRIVYINPAFTNLMGYTRRDVHDQTPRLFRSDHHDEKFYQDMRETLLKDRIWKGTFTNRCKDGTSVELETVITAVLDERGQIANFVSVARDVTHEHQLEKQLVNAQKMEALGTLAGGIAHDFNNILSAIIGYTELGLLDAPEGYSIHNHFTQVLKAARRATDLVSQILTFSRRSAHARQPILLGPIVDEALKLLRGTLPTTIEIRKALDDNMPPILADTAHMHQIIMNLCTNASHAMREKGGVLTVGLRLVSLGTFRAPWQSALKTGDYAELTVEDTGHGMTPETMERIFEPYFTTKHGGDGTGLGLATVHGIVLLYEGAIRVESRPGKGTRFTILLPVCPANVVIPGLPAEQRMLQNGNHAHILVVDDEEAIVKMIEATLTFLGYRVEGFTSSVKAYDTFKDAPESYDAVITDQTMPTLTGTELARRLLEIRPDLPVILCSGYSNTLDAEGAKALGIREYLMKPIAGRALAAVLQKHLPHVTDATA
jgi:PAS domain S-box-containing protein